MALERTLSIIKPDAVRNNNIGNIYTLFETNGLKIVAAKMLHISKQQAQKFYAVHKARPFFGELVEFMSSGPVLVQVLSGENAVQKNRDIMGATNPRDAEVGTIRKLYAASVGENAVHGSDSQEAAAEEIDFFFRVDEIHDR